MDYPSGGFSTLQNRSLDDRAKLGRKPTVGKRPASEAIANIRPHRLDPGCVDEARGIGTLAEPARNRSVSSFGGAVGWRDPTPAAQATTSRVR